MKKIFAISLIFGVIGSMSASQKPLTLEEVRELQEAPLMTIKQVKEAERASMSALERAILKLNETYEKYSEGLRQMGRSRR